MINLLFIESGRDGGGSFESLYQHLRAIDRQRFRPVVAYFNETRFTGLARDLDIPVYVLTDRLLSRQAPPRQQRIARYLRQYAMRLNRVWPNAYLRAARWLHRPSVAALRRIIEAENIHLIHLNVSPARDLPGLLAAEATGVPCLSHLRSTDTLPGPAVNRDLARYANRVVAGYIANSTMTGDCWADRGLDRHKMQLIHNGVPGPAVAPVDLRQRWGIGDDVPFIAGMVASLYNRMKADESLIRGFGRFLQRCPGAVLLVVGEGPVKTDLMRETCRLGLKENIIFAGFQENPAGILAGLDVSLVICDHDSFNRVVIETMQAGTPLVATDVGGIREILRCGENGLLVPYGDDEAFAEALEKLYLDCALREKLARNGSQTIRERFSIEAYSARLAQVYGGLVELAAGAEVAHAVGR